MGVLVGIEVLISSAVLIDSSMLSAVLLIDSSMLALVDMDMLMLALKLPDMVVDVGSARTPGCSPGCSGWSARSRPAPAASVL